MFETLTALQPDPILGLMAKYNADERSDKIDLGVGVYRTPEGLTPILKTVKAAEAWLLNNEDSKAYVGPAGNIGFNQLMSGLIFGEAHSVLSNGRLALVQTPGGCGALRVAAELINRVRPNARLWASSPTWANHVPLLGDAGIEIRSYRYYDYAQHCIDFEGMLEDLQAASEGDYLLLHACCHNPCGADLSQSQWQALARLAEERGLIPFVDMAYQGFGDGLDEDAYGLRTLADLLPEVVLAVSCSKNFGLYRERVGAVGVVCKSAEQANTLNSHILNIVRGIYSMPPSHGASIVEHILADADRRREWALELADMRARITQMRHTLVQQMHDQGAGSRFDFIKSEKGMFSFLGLSEAHVNTLAADYGIYMVGSSRINVAGLNAKNMPAFCKAVLAVTAG